MPGSIGDLRALVDQHAQDLAEGQQCPPMEAEESFAGIGDIIVIAI
jgi:hypothetical protein